MAYPVVAPEVEPLLRQITLVVFDFDGVFTDNTVTVSERGEESVRCWRGDGIGLRYLDRLGIQTMVLSTEENPVVSARCRKLKIDCEQGCPDKRAAIQDIAAARGVPLEAVAFVGNDVNDSGALQLVGLPIVVQDAHPDVVRLARWQTQRNGGTGAVREICDGFWHVLRPEGDT